MNRLLHRRGVVGFRLVGAWIATGLPACSRQAARADGWGMLSMNRNIQPPLVHGLSSSKHRNRRFATTGAKAQLRALAAPAGFAAHAAPRIQRVQHPFVALDRKSVVWGERRAGG